MAVGGIVISLTEDEGLQRAVERLIEDDPRLERGPQVGARVALVATTDSLAEGRDLCEALITHPGVCNLEVAYVAPEDPLPHDGGNGRGDA